MSDSAPMAIIEWVDLVAADVEPAADAVVDVKAEVKPAKAKAKAEVAETPAE
jgi:hypothetical protein